MMPTPHNGFDNQVEMGKGANNMSVGDHVFQEGYEMGDKSIMDLLSANEKLVSKYTEQLCNHFGGVLANLPESWQETLIDSIRVMDGKHDVLYQGMVANYDGRSQANLSTDFNPA